MKKIYQVLIVEDHHLIVDACKIALQKVASINKNLKFNIRVANNCDIANKIILNESQKEVDYLIFLDINLPSSLDGKITSGEDLGLKIIEFLPNSKIIILTALNDHFRIYNLLMSLNPSGFLLKNDITSKELITSIQKVIIDPPYFSDTVVRLLHNQLSFEYYLDKIDRLLLFNISKGVKMKELLLIIPLSEGGIERRKRNLKKIFKVQTETDAALIQIAKEKGFI